jgi:hypothetical protein
MAIPTSARTYAARPRMNPAQASSYRHRKSDGIRFFPSSIAETSTA